MALGIGHNRGRRIKTHRLIVEQTRIELRRAMHFQIRAPIREDGETDRVRFRKSIERKRADRLQDFLDHFRRDVVAHHPGAQFHGHFLHPFLRAMKTEGAPQFLRFITGKIRHDHRDLEHLLLEERDPERALEHRL